MRALAPIAGVAVLLAASGCTVHATPGNVHETKTFPARPDKLVRVDLRSLDVDVKVAEGDTITAVVTLEAQSSSRNASRRWLERNTPVFEDSDSVLEVRLPERGHVGVFVIGFLHTKGRLELTLPPTCRLEVKNSSGDVRIAGSAPLSGTVRVNTSSGDVTVTGGVRELLADTSSGDVRVSGPALASLEADTSSGDVTLSGGTAKAIVDTSSGDVRLEKLTGSLSADTSSGDVRASWEQLPADAKLHARTSSGDVRFGLPAGTRLAGRIETTSGRISSDLPGTKEDHGHQLVFGEPAGVPVEIRTSSGAVVVRTHA